jgi:thiamine-monophosphate kinase
MAGEFDLIRNYFRAATAARSDVVLGIGDDCALLEVPPDRQLAASLDTLVCGRHFVESVDPEALGRKSLAVNLSDLAAMGAEPAWAMLGLTLPEADESWLAAFMRGFGALAAEHGVQLIGGDTTRGPLSVTVQVQGLVEPGRALRRDGAQSGDLVYVSGTLGDAGLALMAQQGLYVRQGSMPGLLQRLDRPSPRVALGLALREFASAAIDLSDGLGSDLGHICERSGVGALLYLENLPLSEAVRDYVQETGDWSVPLSSGDDYELAFCIPAQHQGEFEAASAAWDVPVTWVGMMERGRGVRAMQPDGQVADEVAGGFDHFAD